MNRYMTESGIDIVGSIPNDWILKRLKYLCDITTGDADTQDADSNGEYPFYVRSPIVEKSTRYTFDGEGILMAGDGAGAGRIFHHVFGKYAVHQRVYRLFNFKNISTDYLFYYMSSLFPNEMDKGSAQSTVPSVRLPMLANFYVCLPDFYEQQKIVQYLNSKCSSIDKIIDSHINIIEKLEEYKESFITNVVTKGLNNAEMKKCNYPSIRCFPKHWEIKRLRFIGNPVNGISKGGEYFGKGYSFVSYGDVYKNIELPKTVEGLVESTEDERKKYSVEKGDIFFTRTSETIDEVGFSSVCSETIPNATFAGFLIRVRPFTDELLSGYAKYYFRGKHLRDYFAREMDITTRASLSQNFLKNVPVLIPPKDEQVSIARYLDNTCAKIHEAIDAHKQSIEKLVEYRKSIIYYAVTGKIDCREVQNG